MSSIVAVICVVQLEPELLELGLDLFRRAAVLVDGDDAPLEVDAGLDGAEHLVTGTEDTREEPEFLVEQLEDALSAALRWLRKLRQPRRTSGRSGGSVRCAARCAAGSKADRS